MIWQQGRSRLLIRCSNIPHFPGALFTILQIKTCRCLSYRTVERLHKVPLRYQPRFLRLFRLWRSLSPYRSASSTSPTPHHCDCRGHQRGWILWVRSPSSADLSVTFWRFILSRSTYSRHVDVRGDDRDSNDTVVRCDVSATTFGACSEACC